MNLENLLELVPGRLQTLVRIGVDTFSTTHTTKSGYIVQNVWDFYRGRWQKKSPEVLNTANIPCHWNGVERIEA